MLSILPTTKTTIAALALVGVLALSITTHLGSSPAPSPTDDYPTPDCFCKIGWEAEDFDPPAGQTAPGDWDDEWADKGIKVINVELDLTDHNGGCQNTGTPPACTTPVRPCRKIVSGDVVTDLPHGIKIYWHETNGISETSIEAVAAGQHTTPFTQTLSRPCSDGVPVAYAGFWAAQNPPVLQNGWEAAWGWEMLCDDCDTATFGSSE